MCVVEDGILCPVLYTKQLPEPTKPVRAFICFTNASVIADATPMLESPARKKNISGSGVIDEKQDWEIQESSQATRSGKVATGSKPTEPISGLVMNRQFPTRPAVVVKAVAVDIQLK